MPLPLSNIVNEAISDTWDNRRDVVAYAFLPVLAVSIVSIATTAVIGDLQVIVDNPEEVAPGDAARISFALLISWIARLALYTVFAVAWHRRVLVGPEATSIGAAMRWGPRQWRFFRRLFVLFANLFVCIFFLSLLLMPVLPAFFVLGVLLIATGYIYGRAALALPAAATDTPMTFRESVRLTRGTGGQMFVATVVLPLAIILFGGLIVLLVAGSFAGLVTASITAQFIVSLAAQTINYIGFAVGITALSLAYRHLTT